jgi:tetratricopeptide (TPR) repeat protein
LIAGLAIALWQYSNARRENAKAEVVNDFLKQMLATANPASGLSGKKGYQTTITDILEQAEKRLESEELRDQPEVRAELRALVGAGYVEQGNYIAGEKTLRQALAEQTQLYGPDTPGPLTIEFGLAALFFAKADYDSAESIYGPKLGLLRNEFQKGRIHPNIFVPNLSNYAILRRARGDSIEAEALLREGLAISSQHSLESQTDIQRQFLTLILLDRGRFDEAESIQQAALSKHRNQPNNETPEFCAALTLFGIIMMEKRDLSAAESNLREAETIYRKLYSPNFIAIHDNLRLQAQVAYLAGRYSEAEAKINQVLENYRLNSNPKYISFATALTVQGLTLSKLGRSDQAEKVLREAVKLREENLPAKHFMTALTRGALGECLTERNRYDEAESLLIASYNDLKESQGEQTPRTVEALKRLARLYDAWKKPDQAAQYRASLGNARN